MRALIPYERGDLINRIHQAGEFLSSEHTEHGTLVVARVHPDLAGELAPYELAAVQLSVGSRDASRCRRLDRPRRRRRATERRRRDRGRAGAAVAEIGGHERPGQIEMAAAVGTRSTRVEHLLVQAGTGTGKSLGYLAPALVRLAAADRRPDRGRHRDPGAAEPAGQQRHPGRPGCGRAGHRRAAGHAILKGRTNYACLLKVRDGAARTRGR